VPGQFGHRASIIDSAGVKEKASSSRFLTDEACGAQSHKTLNRGLAALTVSRLVSQGISQPAWIFDKLSNEL
jgi:hypothetical protein